MAGMLETEKYWGIDRVKEDLDKVRLNFSIPHFLKTSQFLIS